MYQEIIINNANNKLLASVESSSSSSSKDDTNEEDEGVSGVVDGDGDADGGVTRISNKNNYLKVSHNSVLNCLFLLTKENKLIVYDCNSFAILKEVDWNLKTCELINTLRPELGPLFIRNPIPIIYLTIYHI